MEECKRFSTCKELLQTVDRIAEEKNTEELSVNDMTELEQELDAALMQTRLRKMKNYSGILSTFCCKEMKNMRVELKVHVQFLTKYGYMIPHIVVKSAQGSHLAKAMQGEGRCKVRTDRRVPSARHKWELDNTLHGYK
ncbi:hypothetical protein L1987_17254 [Smallanthus sonchifolius]|uniref:Uncharacterized protein n=1 Tax=Smallanthus sonchifolius TaxID=185202 RepID=A0ACB9IWA4_9ASTR|nr:hypothetical protein L1987_17254 [Smallanthus sonchifolius]